MSNLKNQNSNLERHYVLIQRLLARIRSILMGGHSYNPALVILVITFSESRASCLREERRDFPLTEYYVGAPG